MRVLDGVTVANGWLWFAEQKDDWGKGALCLFGVAAALLSAAMMAAATLLPLVLLAEIIDPSGQADERLVPVLYVLFGAYAPPLVWRVLRGHFDRIGLEAQVAAFNATEAAKRHLGRVHR